MMSLTGNANITISWQGQYLNIALQAAHTCVEVIVQPLSK